MTGGSSVMLAARPGVDLDLVTGTARWRALGTYVHLGVTDPDALADAAHLASAVLDEVDAACSRFRADSELTRANRATGPVPASPVLVGAVRVALEAAEHTSGVVDPTLGDVLVAAGYSRTFEEVPASDPSPVALPTRRPGWRDVVVTDDSLDVPPGVVLDLGATGKAYASDLVALSVTDRLGTAVVVSVGGDVRVAAPPGVPGSAWTVGLAHTPDGPGARPVTHVTVTDGGLATSSVSARRWTRAGRRWTHLVDPRTLGPVDGPWRTVCATGPTCVAANVAATAAIVLGADAPAWLEARGVGALLLAHDGGTRATGPWPDARPEHDHDGGAP
ncbi:FAD:protein FMN transferase [Intrasporangium sp. YIM S08009]|uniref:FAD:protein FMN transferase n=1 Tax=Intrasporangium zincisolvens TaxID=3080018 RepID=UPI002B062555|nr:FAD:protein FMN transferase [Intrasporangium sp. YIM S08009]